MDIGNIGRNLIMGMSDAASAISSGAAKISKMVRELGPDSLKEVKENKGIDKDALVSNICDKLLNPRLILDENGKVGSQADGQALMMQEFCKKCDPEKLDKIVKQAIKLEMKSNQNTVTDTDMIEKNAINHIADAFTSLGKGGIDTTLEGHRQYVLENATSSKVWFELWKTSAKLSF